MTRKEKAKEVKEYLDTTFGNVKCFLDHREDWQFLFCVMLSAQATDKSVNKVTPILFEKYPSIRDLARADYETVLSIIKPVGLAPTKAKHVLQTASIIVKDYDGILPRDRSILMELPGVGYKTSGVVLGELYDFPYLPVDTHVERVSKLLELVDKKLTPKQIEPKLEDLFKGYNLINTHKQLILLGRTILKANHPDLKKLPFSWLKKD